ncbi:MAG TPA: VTT domain-containing protein [Terriglobales bacterium]|nr:VTT domain-containing protein [Terriglobales bacterium]
MSLTLAAFAALAAETSPIWKWVYRLGGIGLILLGIADNSFVPLPGSMDAFTILLSAQYRDWWPYYGAMATTGSVFGGFLTYRLARKGGKETLEKKVGQQRAEKVYKKFEKHGWFWVMLGAMLPPPFPIVPFLMAAGALQYPLKNFVAALGLGRAVRFFAVAYVGHRYGKHIISFFGQYYLPMLYFAITVGVLAGIGALLYWKWYLPRKKARQQDATAAEPKAA